MEKVYLGDSVYAEFVDGMVLVTTDNGLGPSNSIYLEVEVFEALVTYGMRAWGLKKANS